MQLWVWIGAVTISATSRTKHHVASIDGAFVHLAKMDGAKMDLEGAFVAEGLQARRALDSFFARRRDEHALGAERIRGAGFDRGRGTAAAGATGRGRGFPSFARGRV